LKDSPELCGVLLPAQAAGAFCLLEFTTFPLKDIADGRMFFCHTFKLKKHYLQWHAFVVLNILQGLLKFKNYYYICTIIDKNDY